MPSKPSFFDKLVRRSKNNKRLGDSLAPPTDSADETSLRSRASSRASSAHSAVSTAVENNILTENAPEIEPTVPDVPPISLWPRAYDQVRQENKTLVEEYEKLLAKHLDKESGSDNTSNHEPTNNPTKMARLTEQGLEELTNSRVKYTIFGNDFVLMDQAGQLSSTLVGFKDYVAEALKASPEASMAWAGVALVLPLVTNISTVEAEHKASFIKVLSRMKLYVGMEQLLWPKHLDLQSSARTTLEHEITQLYVSIILFQMESARRFYRRWIMRTVRDAVKYDDWETKVKAVNDAEEVVLNAFRLVTDQAVRSNLDELVLSAGQQTKALIGIADDIKSLLDIQTQGVAYTKEIADGVEMLAQAKSKKLETVKLDMFVDTKAQFDSIDSERAGKCFESTRKTIQQRIKAWAASNTGPNILWVRGLAGTGKSTIARTMAANFAKDGVLAGSYFFRRGDEDRTRSANILSTIMDRAIHCVPGLARHVADALAGKDKTWLRDKGLETQFDTLFRTPLERLLKKGKMSSFTFVIIIDALDECADPGDLGPLISLLAGLNSTEQRFNILLTSRAAGTFESRIREFVVEGENYINLHLEDAEFAEETQNDIQVYMTEMFARTRKQFDIEQDPWPTESEQEILITRAVTPSPLFIYAATLYRFLTNEESLPDDQLEEWLSSVSAGASQLNEIYEPILKNAFASAGVKRHPDLRQLIYAIILSRTPLSRQILSEMFGIKPHVVKGLLKTLHSVIDLPSGQDDAIEIYHKSFSDFLQAGSDAHTTESPYIMPVPAAHGVIALNYVKLLDAKLTRDICGLGDPGTFLSHVANSHIDDCIPLSVEYASRNWVHHLLEATVHDSELAHISDFLHKHLLHWIECAMLLDDFSNMVLSIVALKDYISALERLSVDFPAFLNDAHRFILFVSEFQSTPLQIYGTGLLFCPTSSLIKKIFKNQALSLGVRVDGIQDHWDSVLQSLTPLAFTDHLEYSNNGRLLLAVSYNHVQVWESISGSERFMKLFNYDVCEAQFSADSRLVVVHTKRNDIHILDAESGVLKQKLSGLSFLLPAKHGLRVNLSRYPGLPEFTGCGWNTDSMQKVESMVFTETEVGKRLLELFESNPEDDETNTSSDGDEQWETIYESSLQSGQSGDEEPEIISNEENGSAQHSDTNADSIIDRCSSTSEENSMNETTTDTEIKSNEIAWEKFRRRYRCNVLSPDGKLSVSCGPNNLIIVGDTQTGEILSEITSGIESSSLIVISEDNKLLLLGGKTHEPELWNLCDNVKVWSGNSTPSNGVGYLNYAKFSKCNTFVEMHCYTHLSTLSIKTLTLTRRQFTKGVAVNVMCSTSDGTLAAALVSSSLIEIFNPSSNETTIPYVVDLCDFNAVEFFLISSQDIVAVQYTDGTIELHDEFGQRIRTIRNNQQIEKFSADGKYLICSFPKTGCVAVYETDSLQCVFTSTEHDHGRPPHCRPIATISADSKFLAIAMWCRAEDITVWNLKTGYMVRSIPGRGSIPGGEILYRLLFSETENVLVAVYYLHDTGRISVYRFSIDQDLSNQSLVLEAKGFIYYASFLPKSSKLAIMYYITSSNRCVVELVCVDSGTRLARLSTKYAYLRTSVLEFEAAAPRGVRPWEPADGYWNLSLETTTRELASPSDGASSLSYQSSWIARDGDRLFQLPAPYRLGHMDLLKSDKPMISPPGNAITFSTQNNNVIRITMLEDEPCLPVSDVNVVQHQHKASDDSTKQTDSMQDNITRREVSFVVSEFFYKFATRDYDLG